MSVTTAKSEAIRVAPQWVRPVTLFGVLTLLLLAVNYSTLMGLIKIWWETATYQHGFIVAPVVGWLIWRQREALGRVMPNGSLLALLPIAVFSAISLLGSLGGIAMLHHIGMVGSLMSFFPLAFGWSVTRALWFPILFLGFLIPAGDFLIAPLQLITADASVWLIQLTGVPVYREGLWIELPTGLWEVAEACAGLRFIIANLFVAALFAYLSYDKAWKWIVFGLLSILIPIGANCIRAYGIMMIAHFTNNAFAVGVDHLLYGWVFFSFVMLLMLWIGSKFADRKLEDPVINIAEQPKTRAASTALAGFAAIGLLAAPHAVAAATAPSAAPLPDQIAERLIPAGWTAMPIDTQAPDRWVPRFKSADRIETYSLTDGEHVVDLFVAAYTHQREGAEAVHWANRFDDDEIWIRSRLAGITLSPEQASLPANARLDELTYTERSAAGNRFATRIVASWTVIGDMITASGKQAKLAGIKSRLFGGPAQAGVIALSARYGPPEYRQHALQGIEKLREALPPLNDLVLTER